MKRALPPFSAVRAFEAAARHLSFKSAAEELNVSQSAISHQIKALEEFLQQPLFRRCANAVTLTDTGNRYYHDVSLVLDQLDETTRNNRKQASRRSLHVRSTPAFAARWLLRNVNDFNTTHPEIELKVTTSIETTDFRADDVDLLVQYGQQGADGLSVEAFMTTSRIPVCSPELISKGPPIVQPGDLLQHTLLRDMVGDEWADWFKTAGVECRGRISGPIFEHCDLSLRAAEQGQGIALAYEALIERELANGTLVRLCNAKTRPNVVYSLACPQAWLDRTNISAFRSWLFKKTRRQICPQVPAAAANNNHNYLPAYPYRDGPPRGADIHSQFSKSDTIA